MQLLAIINGLAAWEWLLVSVLAVLGLLALVSPRRFSQLAERGGNWIDTNKYLSVLDKRVDIDHVVLPFSRVLGFSVLASAVILAVLLSR